MIMYHYGRLKTQSSPHIIERQEPPISAFSTHSTVLPSIIQGIIRNPIEFIL